MARLETRSVVPAEPGWYVATLRRDGAGIIVGFYFAHILAWQVEPGTPPEVWPVTVEAEPLYPDTRFCYARPDGAYVFPGKNRLVPHTYTTALAVFKEQQEKAIKENRAKIIKEEADV